MCGAHFDVIRSPIEIIYEGRNKLSNWGTDHVMVEYPFALIQKHAIKYP